MIFVYTWLLLYVDDILITGNDKGIQELIEKLKKEFEAKDFGEAKIFLGLEIERTKEVMKLTQRKQIEKMLNKFKMKDSNGSKIPMTKGFQANISNEEIDVPYRELIGSLMFVSTVSRPDITFATCYLSKFLDKPNKECWTEGKKILRYLKETIDLGLTYKKSENTNIVTYSDADWASNTIDRRSTSGSVSFYCENAVSWFSRKQGCVALSSAEAEYIAAATSVCDMINIKGLCYDFKQKVDSILYVDNRGAIDMTNSYENSKRTKHIDTRYHFIKDLVMSKEIKILYIESKNNCADIFTKSLSYDHFAYLRSKLNIC